jgi:hypothetical protein
MVAERLPSGACRFPAADRDRFDDASTALRLNWTPGGSDKVTRNPVLPEVRTQPSSNCNGMSTLLDSNEAPYSSVRLQSTSGDMAAAI